MRIVGLSARIASCGMKDSRSPRKARICRSVRSRIDRAPSRIEPEAVARLGRSRSADRAVKVLPDSRLADDADDLSRKDVERDAVDDAQGIAALGELDAEVSNLKRRGRARPRVRP